MNKEIKKITGQEAVDHINNIIECVNKLCSLNSSTVYFELIKESVKSEPDNPIIVQSGNTWVAEYDGEDYLAVDGIETFNEIESDLRRREVFEEDLHLDDGMWKLFSEIEITDDIAKLRCKIVCNKDKATLYGVDGNDDDWYVGIWDRENEVDKFNPALWRLATVKDLTEVK